MTPAVPSVVAVAAAAGGARSLVPLVALVGAGHRIVSWHRTAGSHVDAVIATDPDAVGAVASLAGAGDPVPAVACRVDSTADLVLAHEAGARATFTHRSDLEPTGEPGEPVLHIVPRMGLDLSRHPVIPPLARARMRQSLALPDQLVLAVDSSAAVPDRSTSLALASAAVVDVDLLPLALALGTPVVTDVSAARRLGLTDGVQVLVAPRSADADRLAARLARDEERCAALSRNARAFAEQHLDLGAPAHRLRRLLGLEPEPALIDLRLDELATPLSSRLHQRTHTALSLFTMEPTR